MLRVFNPKFYLTDSYSVRKPRWPFSVFSYSFVLASNHTEARTTHDLLTQLTLLCHLAQYLLSREVHLRQLPFGTSMR